MLWFLMACGGSVSSEVPVVVLPAAWEVAESLYDHDRVTEVEVWLTEEDALDLSAEKNEIFDLLLGEDCLAEPVGTTYTWFHGDVRLDGVPVADVGIRKKGLIGSQSSDKPGLKVDFDHWVEGQLFDGVERLTLNNSVSDPSFLKQCLGYALFERGGLPASRCGFAHVVANEAFDLGLYVNVEPVKKRFLARSFGDDEGALYEGTMSDFRTEFTETFEPKTGDTDEGLSAIYAVQDALDAPDDTLIAELDRVLDLDQFFRFWALEVLIGHIDGYAGNANNFLVYVDPADQRMDFVPWGIDAIFLDDSEMYATGVLANRLLAHPEGRARYADAMKWALADVWDEAWMLAELDVMQAATEPFVDPAQRGPEVEELRSWIRARRGVITASLSDLPEPEALREPPCLVSIGTVELTFVALYGTLSDDPMQTGSGSVVSEVEGEVSAFDGGAVAGERDGAVHVVATGLLGEDVVQVDLKLAELRPGVVELDGTMSVGDLLVGPDLATLGSAATLAIGEVVLSEAHGYPGGAVIGTATAELLVGGL